MRRLWRGPTLAIRIRRLFQEHPDDPLPREWIAVALLASIGAGVLGGIKGGWSFWENVLASVVLLGPGLLLTNVVATRWRTRRRAVEIQPILNSLGRSLTPFLAGLSAVMRAAQSDASIEDAGRIAVSEDLVTLKESLRDGCALLRERLDDMRNTSAQTRTIYGRYLVVQMDWQGIVLARLLQ